MKIEFVGLRSKADALFAKSGIVEADALPHTPYIVLVPGEPGEIGDVVVRVVRSTQELLSVGFRDDAEVMVQWQGAKRSDYFHFTVGELKGWLANNEGR